MIEYIKRLLLVGIGCLVLTFSSMAVEAADQPIPINRLLKPHSQENRTLKEDGIHDPANPAVAGKLKDPTQVLQTLVSAKNGNFVDWNASLEKGLIAPQYDSQDKSMKPMMMDLDITIDVKGSAPNVVFPHSAHLQWLQCNNCHPAIFQAKKGANRTSMDKILRGESCGVCHGSVAFPINNCERCHSQKKASASK
ncbi:MAG: cytochrome c3 family protein [Gammaproteobacteria bacterium]|jgi:c(7)-type cytochrome triheme protein